jgi:hypothetical protein
MRSVLTPQEMERPEAVLAGFFGSYSISDADALLWDMAARSLCASDEELGEFGRKEILAGYEALERLVQAAHCLYAR